MIDREYLGRLLNARGGWICDDDLRLMLQTARQVVTDPTDMNTISEIDNHLTGDIIPATSERLRLIYNLLNKTKGPKGHDIIRIADNLQRGAVRGGLSHAPWIKEAYNLLISLAPHSITVDDDSDE